MPTNTLTPLFEALICGKPFDQQEWTQLFAQLGLMHFFVVSGFHLNLLEGFFSKWKASYFVFAALTLYGSICAWNPPVLRTYIFWLLKHTFREKELYWKPWHYSLASGCVCLLLDPNLLLSKSLLISWSASLLIHSKPIKDLLNVYLIIGLSPLITHFSNYHPVILVSSFLFSIVFQYLLFPITFLIWLLPKLVTGTWQMTLNQLKHILLFTPNYTHIQQPNILFYWVYFLLIVYITYQFNLFNRRSRR